ncbi:CoA transferase [Streptantibioticus silvisoli]|uniref:CoA transferase n=1 Tax=Streptantibioticus silvisoli TaxID=2705255 RepID=A0ABT6W9G4_9ACTN|nr:CoA transferase [Streptantibioticus silvisoli]MDI5966303.1 CoA transferase [Streptantibioticus silvisoli]
MTQRWESATEELWGLLGGDASATASVTFTLRPADILPSRLPVATMARAAIAVCALAAAELAALRTGGPLPAVEVDDGAVAAAFTSERLLRVDGAAPIGFAPHSGFWPAADGWVRTHANYPHHRDRLLTALGLPAGTDPDGLATALRGLPAAAVQERAYAAGALAVAVRDAAASEATDRGPLLETGRLPGPPAAPRVFGPLPAGVLLPAHGVRVLDLTRTIAGPIATRTLALLGADVLRVDHPALPDEAAHLDSGFGKRSTRLDLDSPPDRAVFDDLLATADVLVTGYRPGALDRFGLTADHLARRHPGLVIGRLSAWGRHGRWADRRGFDSLVQAATGIAVTESRSPGRPGALPCQGLDHATGYLLAAAVLRALTARSTAGGTRTASLSLAATARWLTEDLVERREGGTGAGTGAGAETGAGEVADGATVDGDVVGAAAGGDVAGGSVFDPAPWLTEVDAAAGRMTYAVPAVRFAGGPVNWATPPGRWGADAPVWLPRDAPGDTPARPLA